MWSHTDIGKREAVSRIDLQEKNVLELFEKNKISYSWKYWMWVPSNCDERKTKKRTSQKN